MIRNIKRKSLAVAALSAVAVSLTACGSYEDNHDYNAPAPQAYVTPSWVRVETPGNWTSLIRACVGGDGIYVNKDNYTTVVPHDPACDVQP
jgi:hypothetical protein